MLIVGLNGSPSKKDNTVTLLKAALEPARLAGADTDIIHVTDALKNIKLPYCVACTNPCSGACYKDTELEQAFELLAKADGIIIGSPVYFGTVSGQLKAFWDKTRLLRNGKKLLNAVGGAVTVGASRFGGQETTVKAIHDMMLVQGMTIVGDGDDDADAGHHGGCAQRPAATDDFALKRAQILGKRVFAVAQATVSLRG